MKHALLLPTVAFLAAGLALATACAPRTQSPAEIEYFRASQYFTTPVQDQLYRLSPDGGKLARLEQHGNAVNIVVRDLESGAEFRATDFREGRVNAFDWANDERLLFFTRHEAAVYAVDYDGGRQRLLNAPGEYLQVIHRLPAQRNHVLAAKPGRYSQSPDVFSVNIYSGRATQVKKGPGRGYPERWYLDASGGVRAAMVRARDDRVLVHYDPRAETWRTTPEPPGVRAPVRPLDAPLEGSIGIAFTGARVLDRAPYTLHRYDFNTGRLGAELFALPAAECCELLVSPRDGRLISATARTGLQRHTMYADPGFERAARELSQAFEGRDVRFISLDDEERRGVAVVGSAVYEPDYFLFDLMTGSFELLADSPAVLATLARLRENTPDIVIVQRGTDLAFDIAATQLPSGLQNRQVDTV